MADSSFDIVSKLDHQEIDNALNQAQRELTQRFDFKNTGATIEWSGDQAVEITANAEDRALAVLDVFKDKLIKRNQSLKILDAGDPRQSGRDTKITVALKEGISQEHAKKIGKLIRDEGPKGVKVQVQGDELRVSEQEARRPAVRDRPGQGAGLRLRGAVQQLPLTAPRPPGPLAPVVEASLVRRSGVSREALRRHSSDGARGTTDPSRPHD